MRVLIVVAGVPAVSDATGYVFPSFIEGLKPAGHQVTCCFLLEPADPEETRQRAQRLAWFEAHDVDTISVEAPMTPPRRTWRDRWRQLLRPTLADLYPWVTQRPALERLLLAQQPDVIFILETYQGLAATHGLTMAPRFALLGDPEHLPAAYRRRMGWSREPHGLKALYRAILERHRLNAMRVFLRGLDGGGAVAAHHAEWFRRNGLRDCRYLRNPVPDLAGPSWQARRAAAPAHAKPKLLFVGHVRGTATLAGLRVFARQTLPILEDRLGPDQFEVHVIGRYALPPDVARQLSRPSVRLRGFVEDLDQEYLTAALFVVPTPIELGVRTRIVFAWSFGCCVVAHQANCAGLPEMRHEENALIAGDGRGLADAILHAIADPKLRQRVGTAGRKAYEQHFHPAAAGAAIVAELEQTARVRNGTTVEPRHVEAEALRS